MSYLHVCHILCKNPKSPLQRYHWHLDISRLGTISMHCGTPQIAHVLWANQRYKNRHPFRLLPPHGLRTRPTLEQGTPLCTHPHTQTHATMRAHCNKLSLTHTKTVYDNAWRRLIKYECLSFKVSLHKPATNSRTHLCGKRPAKVRHPMDLHHPAIF